MEIYPLRFNPIFKERIWGGQKLHQVLGKDIAGDRIGESWEISGVPGDMSVVANGTYSGRTIQELISAYPEAFLGKKVYERFGTVFPILIKFIDAREDLSIQLHPDDTLARQRHNSFGKTEMWYIMDADPDASLIVGFKRDVSPSEYEQALSEGTLTELLHYQNVQPGEGYFIGAGKIHAIGAGVLLAEIQQTSDVTYRVYDFDRKDADGNLRELHTDLALDAMDFERKDDFRMTYSRETNRQNTMVDCPYFTTSYLSLDQDTEIDLQARDSFTVLMAVNGKAQVDCDSEKIEVKKGETVLIPAAAEKVRIWSKGCELLQVSL